MIRGAKQRPSLSLTLSRRVEERLFAGGGVDDREPFMGQNGRKSLALLYVDAIPVRPTVPQSVSTLRRKSRACLRVLFLR